MRLAMLGVFGILAGCGPDRACTVEPFQVPAGVFEDHDGKVIDHASPLAPRWTLALDEQGDETEMLFRDGCDHLPTYLYTTALLVDDGVASLAYFTQAQQYGARGTYVGATWEPDPERLAALDEHVRSNDPSGVPLGPIQPQVVVGFDATAKQLGLQVYFDDPAQGETIQRGVDIDGLRFPAHLR